MAMPILDRRGLLARGAGLVCAAALTPFTRAAFAGAVCTPDYAGDKEQRAALHYAEQSSNPNQTCENCQYFENRGRCGNCRILSCLVNPAGTCDSWSKKAD